MYVCINICMFVYVTPALFMYNNICIIYTNTNIRTYNIMNKALGSEYF